MNAHLSALIIYAISFTSIAAWLTHVYVSLSDEQWGFLIAGAIFFPVAIFHGVGVWAGVY